MDIEQLLNHILDYEEEVSTYELSISTIQTLMTLYTKAIEYYSAIDNLTQTGELLSRMQTMMGREDVSIVLNSYEDESKYYSLINNL